MNRNLSRMSNKHATLSWGSSRRPSVLNSFFNGTGTDNKMSTGGRHSRTGSTERPQNRGVVSKISRLLHLRQLAGERCSQPVSLEMRPSCDVSVRPAVRGSTLCACPSAQSHSLEASTSCSSLREGRHARSETESTLLRFLGKMRKCPRSKICADISESSHHSAPCPHEQLRAPPNVSTSSRESTSEGVSHNSRRSCRSVRSHRSSPSPRIQKKSSHPSLSCCSTGSLDAGSGHPPLDPEMGIGGEVSSSGVLETSLPVQSECPTTQGVVQAAHSPCTDCTLPTCNNNHEYMNITADLLSGLREIQNQALCDCSDSDVFEETDIDAEESRDCAGTRYLALPLDSEEEIHTTFRPPHRCRKWAFTECPRCHARCNIPENEDCPHCGHWVHDTPNHSHSQEEDYDLGCLGGLPPVLGTSVPHQATHRVEPDGQSDIMEAECLSPAGDRKTSLGDNISGPDVSPTQMVSPGPAQRLPPTELLACDDVRPKHGAFSGQLTVGMNRALTAET